MRRFTSLISGVIFGSIFGVALTLLLTPSSGKRLREQIGDYAQEIVLEVNQAASQKRSDMQEELAKLRQPGD